MSPHALIFSMVAFGLVSTDAGADELWHKDEPGHRESIGEEGTAQTPQQIDFLNCLLREHLNAEFVEACAIFKENERRFVECRYYPDTYEEVPSREIADYQNNVIAICSTEHLSKADPGSGNLLKDIWSRLFGE